MTHISTHGVIYNQQKAAWEEKRFISHSVDVVPQERTANIVQNISVIDGYMAIVFALGIIKFRVNSHKYHLKLDLKGELAFVYQQRLSGVSTSMTEKQKDRCKHMMSAVFFHFPPNLL